MKNFNNLIRIFLCLFLLFASEGLSAQAGSKGANIIYHSDFNELDGWDKDNGEAKYYIIKSGELKFRISDGKLLMGGVEASTGINKLMTLPINYSRDFSIEMSIAPTANYSEYFDYGILFGTENGKPKNLFTISPTYKLYSLFSTGSAEVKYYIELTKNEIIKNKQYEFNIMRIEKIGNVVSAFINGVKVGSSSSIKFYGEKLGIYFAAYFAEGVAIDYFTVAYLGDESTVAESQRLSPKETNPPEILITSPIVTRGLKVVQSNSNLTITGYAKDESGIASLKINDIETAFDATGNFSTNITLKPGDNTFIVTAKDKVNNVATFNFTIEKAITSALTKPNIIPVTIAQKAAQGKYYALVIGVQDYKDPTINDLDEPVADATSLAAVLGAKYTFDKQNITLLKNPTRSEMFRSLENLSQKIGPEDNLLIFYAGHGYWDAVRKQGYWFPSDAGRIDRSSWLTNADLKEYISSIPSKHTLLITDACFAGSIFKSRAISTSAPRAIKELYELPSRKAMTSGTLKEVPDKSVFIEYLVKRLNLNTSTYLSAEKLYSSFRDAVINNSANGQVPQYGEIREAGDEGGDFIFIKREP